MNTVKKARALISRAATVTAAIAALLVVVGCGPAPSDVATSSIHTKDATLTLELRGLATASAAMVSGDIPGCRLGANPVGRVVLMRHPHAFDLLVVLVNGTPRCIDSVDVAVRFAKPQGGQGALNSRGLGGAEGESDDPPADDPVPINGQTSGSQTKTESTESSAGHGGQTGGGQGGDNVAVGDISDDPVPINGQTAAHAAQAR